MIDPVQPIGSIKKQILSSMPISIGTTLVDDTVALVDDPNALTGSQTTQIPFLRVSADSNAPSASIHIRR